MGEGLMKLGVCAFLVAGALVLFGCGGGSDSTSSLSKAEFTKTVNRMCEREDEERKAAKLEKQKEMGLEPGELANASQHDQIVAVTLSFYESMTAQIAELAPDDQAEQVAAIVDAREELAKVVKKDGPPAASFAAIKKANERATAYGLDGCTI